MTATPLVLVITGALIHAYWNVQMKRARGGPGFIWLFTIVSVLALLPIGGMRSIELGTWVDPRLLAAAGASAVIHVLYHYALQLGYRTGDFSTVYPIARGVAPMLTVAGAALLLSESVPLTNWVGAGAIAAGIVMLTFQGGTGGAASGRGVGWATLTGLSIAAYSLVDGWAITDLHADPIAYYFVSQVFRVILFAPAALAAFDSVRTAATVSLREVALVGVLSPVAYLLALIALQHAPVSQVAPLREISMLFGALAGGMHFGERLGWARLLGILSIAAGALLVALG
jgi:drug/metabolite transporter (DMT)-like permease